MQYINGSSLAVPANGLGGSRATNKIKASQKNRTKPEKTKNSVETFSHTEFEKKLPFCD